MAIATCGRCGAPFGYSCMCRVQEKSAAAAAFHQQMSEAQRMRKRAKQEEDLRSRIIDGEFVRVDDGLPLLPPEGRI